MSTGNEDSLGKIIKTPEQAERFMRDLRIAGKVNQPLTFSQLLEGCDALVKTDVGDVRVTISKVEIKTRTIETGKATPENDWWPESYDYEYYLFIFTNGTSKEFKSLNDVRFFI